MTSTAIAEALVRRYIEEGWNRGDMASLDELTVPTARDEFYREVTDAVGMSAS